MAKATRTPPRPAPRPAQQKSTTTANRAQQAARHQGRDDPPPRQQPAQQTATQQRPAPRQAPPPARVPAQVRASAMPSSSQLVGSNGQLPDWAREYGNAGKENISREDLEIPRLKLMQGLSPELQTYDELRAGHFLHTANEYIFEEPFAAVPVFIDKRYMLWRPRDQGGGILARADDGIHWNPPQGEFTVQLDKKDGGDTVTWRLAPTVQASGLAEWGSMNPNDPQSPPAATQMLNFVLMFPENPELMPAVLTFQRSSVKRGRRFLTKVVAAPGAVFIRRYIFSSVVDHNNAGQEFFNIDVVGDGMVEDKALRDQYQQIHNDFQQLGLAIKDIETLQDEPGDETSTETAGEGVGPAF